jgi:hypothetical protein
LAQNRPTDLCRQNSIGPGRELQSTRQQMQIVVASKDEGPIRYWMNHWMQANSLAPVSVCARESEADVRCALPSTRAVTVTYADADAAEEGPCPCPSLKLLAPLVALAFPFPGRRHRSRVAGWALAGGRPVPRPTPAASALPLARSAQYHGSNKWARGPEG